ncbi:MAG: NAD(P)/FAD-dependent oxidoreductase [Planctomycetes bacterium]|nr:NAD(P)/FAD-dependent oxidoreductase [Planctomycetota bacterium]
MIASPSKSSYDVVVIGGGPAGTTAATLLQRQGHRCLVLESSTFPRYHIGESLIPHTHDTFDHLGLLPKLRASHFPVKHSVRFIPPSGKDATPFYFSETIEGERATTWQVERGEFDQLCQDNARDAGVEIRSATKVNNVIFDDEGAVGVRAQSDGQQSEDIAARVVIDASGRATIIGQQLNLKTDVPGLDKASIWTYYEGGHRGTGIDAGETTVFMIPHRGWFWYIPLANDMVSVGVVASPEYLFRDSNRYEDVFPREVEQCEALSSWLADAGPLGPLRGLRRLAYLNRQVVGNGWVMVGDAAGFLDPIYSSGLFLALASGELAAQCIHDALEADDVSAERLGKFVPLLWEGIEVIHRLIRAFYDPSFSFHKFAQRFPEQRAALIDCLVGDVVGKDMTAFLNSLAEMTPAPQPLHAETESLTRRAV